MEAKENIFKRMKPILKPGQGRPEELTEEILNAILEGEANPEIEEAYYNLVDAEQEYLLTYYFYHASFKLFEGIYYDLELTSYERPIRYNLDLCIDYTILADYITGLNSYYYDNITELYNKLVNQEDQQQYNHLTPEQESLNFFLYNLGESLLQGEPQETTPTDSQILEEFKPYYQELRHIDYKKLFTMIKAAYQEIIKDIHKQLDKSIQEEPFQEFITESYIQAEDNIRYQVYNGYNLELKY